MPTANSNIWNIATRFKLRLKKILSKTSSPCACLFCRSRSRIQATSRGRGICLNKKLILFTERIGDKRSEARAQRPSLLARTISRWQRKGKKGLDLNGMSGAWLKGALEKHDTLIGLLACASKTQTKSYNKILLVTPKERAQCLRKNPHLN